MPETLTPSPIGVSALSIPVMTNQIVSSQSVKVISYLAAKVPGVADELKLYFATAAGQFLLREFHVHVMSDLDPIIDGFIGMELGKNPSATEQEVTDAVDGDCWHYARHRLGFMGFLVDIFANDPAYDNPLRSLIAQRWVTDTQSQAAPETSPAPTTLTGADGAALADGQAVELAATGAALGTVTGVNPAEGTVVVSGGIIYAASEVKQTNPT